jgi:hypothetical protein
MFDARFLPENVSPNGARTKAYLNVGSVLLADVRLKVLV